MTRPPVNAPSWMAAYTVDDEYAEAFAALGEPAAVASNLPTLLDLVDWSEAFARPPVDAVVDGLLVSGRWTALVAPAKAGKSTLALHVAHRLARGLDAFSDEAREPAAVLYLDGEMGELDVIERLRQLGFGLALHDLARLHYTDARPKGDTVQGGAAIVSTAINVGAVLVVLDGLNAFVTGAEKDDTPWRALYENTIAPLKRAGCAVLSSDNTGKVPANGARGSSVKLDKADAIIAVTRTNDGLKLKTTHQRSTAYDRELALAITGIDGSEPISYRHVKHSWPAGTEAMADDLDRLGVPMSDGRDKAAAI